MHVTGKSRGRYLIIFAKIEFFGGGGLGFFVAVVKKRHFRFGKHAIPIVIVA